MLVIFSDVHLTDGASGTIINPRAFDKFGKILSDIIGEDPKEKQIEKIEVVLLGDIFDIIRSELWLRPENDNQTFPVRPWSKPEVCKPSASPLIKDGGYQSAPVNHEPPGGPECCLM